MTNSPIYQVSAIGIRDSIINGELSVSELARKLIEYVKEVDGEICALTNFNPEQVMIQAQFLDNYKATGEALGPLHGVPIVLKDIIDTEDHPTENGIDLDSGRVAKRDAFLVGKLRQAGALILGKGRTTPLAFMDPTLTRNPKNLEKSPGGSSSGCAAAVSAWMAPLAVGTQTGGSVIRPAAFCGVVGFKPSFGLISRSGVLAQSPSLDTVGVIANNLEDAALLTDVLVGFDPLDSATKPIPARECLRVSRERVPVKPMFAFLDMPSLNECSEDMLSALRELESALDEQAFFTELPRAFEECMEARRTVNFAEMAKCYYKYYEAGSENLPAKVREAIEIGLNVPARDYLGALDWRSIVSGALEEIFERADVLVCPSTLGEAPDYGDVGDPVFNSLWTFTGHPVVNLPIFESDTGLPMGIQLIGQINDDGRLLRTARWLVEFLEKNSGEVI